MMSSFKPDARRPEREFVALAPLSSPAFDPEPAASVATDGPVSRSAAAVAGGGPAVEATPEPPSPEPAPWTAEQVERLEREAFERGVASAHKQLDALDRACSALEAGAKALQASGMAAVAAHRELMLELASEIARRWVGVELARDRALLTGVLERVLGACETQAPTRLRLHPGDLAALLEEAEERIASWRDRFGIDLVDDERLDPGEFRLEAEHACVDGRGDVVLSRLREALADALATSLEGLDP